MTTKQAVIAVLCGNMGATRTRLANALGVSLATVYNWERGNIGMSTKHYAKFKELFPNIEIDNVHGRGRYGTVPVSTIKCALPTKDAIDYVLDKDTAMNKAKLAELLGVTRVTMSNYASGRTRINETTYNVFRALYPHVRITDVYGN